MPLAQTLLASITPKTALLDTVSSCNSYKLLAEMAQETKEFGSSEWFFFPLQICQFNKYLFF